MNKKQGIIVVVVVLVLTALAAAGYFFVNRPGEVVTRLDSGDELVTAAAGRKVSSFPQALFLEPRARIVKSYAVNYISDGLTQPVLEYESGYSLEKNIQLFGEYLSANGWSFGHMAALDEAPVTYFYVIKGDEQVNVSFMESPDYKVAVNVAYAVKTQ